jgi:hypothetical protein
MHHDYQPTHTKPLTVVEFDRSGTTVTVDAVSWTSPMPTLQLARRASSGAAVTIRIPPRFRVQFLRAVQAWVAECDEASRGQDGQARPPARCSQSSSHGGPSQRGGR